MKGCSRICVVCVCLGLASSAGALGSDPVKPSAVNQKEAEKLSSPDATSRAPSAAQRKCLDDAKRESVTVLWNNTRGVPSSVEGDDLSARKSYSAGKGLVSKGQGNYESDAIAVLDNLSGLFSVKDARQEFFVKRSEKDLLNYHHVRMEQRHQGLRVFGAQMIVHYNKAGKAYQVNGDYIPDITVDPTPVVAATQAIAIAGADLKTNGLNGVVEHDPELMILAYHTDPKLAYEVDVRIASPKPMFWRVWVDAATGAILLKYDDIKSIAAPGTNGFHTSITGTMLSGEGGAFTNVTGWYENSNATYYLYNTNLCWLIYNAATNGAWNDLNTYANRSSNNWASTDRSEFSSARNMEIVQTYYKQVHGRSSYDNLGSVATVNIHVGNHYVNGYWDPDAKQFYIGDGDGVFANELSVLDVLGHEFTHGVTENSASLIYQDESGALNESFSDIFGAAIEFYAQADGRSSYPGKSPGKADWLVGEDCWLPTAALRDIRSPGNAVTLGEYIQPSRYHGTNWYYGYDDNGGVHNNSGPHNMLFYLLSDGGSGTNDGLVYNLEGIGITNAEKLAYRALTVYCVPATDYSGCRAAWISAARDINSNWIPNVRSAWAAVGLNPYTLGPTTGVNYYGPEGGPFASARYVYTVSNRDVSAISWGVVFTQQWVSLSSSNGVLSPGEIAAFTVTVNNASTLLPPGTYSDTLYVTNNLTPVANSRRVSLQITHSNLYYYSMDTNPGWSTEGGWAYGRPTGGGSHSYDPTSAFSGTNCYGCNLNGDYSNNMTSAEYLTTTAFSLYGYTNAHLSFWRWLGVENSLWDHASIQASVNGTNWYTVWSATDTISDSYWNFITLDLSAVIDDEPTVWLRWGMGPTDGDTTYPGWNIDDAGIQAQRMTVPGNTARFSLYQNQMTCSETSGTIAVDIKRDWDTNVSAQVDYATSNKFALAGSDYVMTTGTVFFAPGVVKATVHIPIINDSAQEPKETFTFNLFNPGTNGQAGKISSCEIMIVDDDCTVTTNFPIELTDGSNILWRIYSKGILSNMVNNLTYNIGHNLQYYYEETNATVVNDREIFLGPQIRSDGSKITRRIYVPTNYSYIRYIEIVENPTPVPMDTTLALRSGLKSSVLSTCTNTSSGDSNFTTEDNWIVTDDGNSFRPAITHVFANDYGRQRPAEVTFTNGYDWIYNVLYYYDLHLEPGETKMVMHFGSISSNEAVASPRARELESLGQGSLTNLTAADMARIVNFGYSTTQSVVVSSSTLTVPEGGTASFYASLQRQPDSNVTVRIAYSGGDTNVGIVVGMSGDSGVIVSSAVSLVFSPANWSVGQPVLLHADEDDGDAINGVAYFRCSAPDMGSTNVIATEADNDTLGTMLIDLGMATNTTPGNWNNVTDIYGSDPAVMLVDTTGLRSDIGVYATDWFESSGNRGVHSSGLYPQSAQEDYFRVTPANPGAIRLSNLNTNRSYRLKVFGSIASGSSLTYYSVNGITQSLSAGNNVSNTVTFTDLRPDSNAGITLQVSTDSTYGYLNVLELVDQALVGGGASNFLLTVQANNPAWGSVSPTGGVYDAGANVQITATPGNHYHFVSWTGDVTSVNNPTNVIVNARKTVTAVFAGDPLTLSVSSAYGTPSPNGTVTNGYGSALTPNVNSPIVNGITQFVCNGWTMTGNEPQSGTSNSFGMTLTNNAVLAWLWTTNIVSTSALPFSETFDGAGMASTLGNVNGQHGWVSDSTNNVVTTNKANGGSQSLVLSTGTVSHAFINTTGTVQISYWAIPCMGESVSAVPANASAVFWFATNGQVMAYSNSSLIQVSGFNLPASNWIRFDITCDYTAHAWSLSVNGTNVLQNFGFYSNRSSFSSISILQSAIINAYVDDLNISNAVAGASGDSDGDGLPDDWEILHYGNITTVAGTNLAANGINTVLEAYIAGLNPADSAAVFKVLDQKLQAAGRVLTWDATNGRLYSVYFTTNLLTPDLWPLISETAGGSITDTTHGADNQGFYRIKVRMTP